MKLRTKAKILVGTICLSTCLSAFNTFAYEPKDRLICQFSSMCFKKTPDSRTTKPESIDQVLSKEEIDMMNAIVGQLMSTACGSDGINNHICNDGSTLLHMATKFGCTWAVKYLLETYEGIDVNAKDCMENTALHIAAKNLNMDIMSILIEHRASTNAVNRKNETAMDLLPDKQTYLSALSKISPIQLAGQFVKACGAKLSSNGRQYKPTAQLQPLTQRSKDHIMWIADYVFAIPDPSEYFEPEYPVCDLFDTAEHLEPPVPLEDYLGGPMGKINYHKTTLLHWAARYGCDWAVRYLLENGSPLQVYEMDDTGRTPLHYALRQTSPTVVDTLLQHNARVDIDDLSGACAFDVATNVDIYDKLLQYASTEILARQFAKICGATFRDGIIIRQPDSEKYLSADDERKIKDIITCTVEIIGGVNSRAYGIYTLLDFAVLCRCKQAVRYLLKTYPEIEAGTPSLLCRTPLRTALFNYSKGKTDIVSIICMLDSGKSITERFVFGDTPLHVAAEEKSIDIVALLLSRGAPVNIKNNIGNTPLHIAVENDDIDIANLLSKPMYKPLINEKNNQGNTPLHIAAENGNVSIINLLLKRGAAIDATNNMGNTALHIAAMNKNNEVTEFLFNQGANFNAVNKKGQAPLDFIRVYSPELINHLWPISYPSSDLRKDATHKPTRCSQPPAKKQKTPHNSK